MIQITTKQIFKFFLVCLLILAPAAGTHWVLNAQSSFLLIIVYAVMSQGLSFMSNYRSTGKWQRFFSIASTVHIFIGGFILITYIIIIPFSAYRIWFDLLEIGKMRGIISYVFVLFLTYSSCLIFINVYQQKILPSLLLYVTILCFTYFMIYSLSQLLPVFFALLLITALINFRWRAISAERKRGITVFFLLLLLSSGLTAVFSLLPNVQGSSFVGGRLSPGLRRAVLRVFPKFPVLAIIPGYGFSMPVKNLADRPSLSEYPLFELDMEPGSRHYLRTIIYDYYSGKGWYTTIPPSDDPGITFLSLTETPPDLHQKINIRITSDFYPYIPHTLRTLSVSGLESIDISFGDINTGYSASVPLLFDQKLTLYEAIDPSLKRGAVTTNTNLKPKLRDFYLSVPVDMDESVLQLGKILALGNLADKLSAIEDYLADGFIYDLEVPSVRSDGDFLSRFLFNEKRGYCVHFATSCVILARLAGIPARYATGFLVCSSGSYEYSMGIEKKTITGLNAHAWAEIWVKGKGWITMETTPPMIPKNQKSSDFWNNLISGDSRFTRRQAEVITGIVYVSEDRKYPVMAIFFTALLMGGIAVPVIFLVKRQPWTASSEGRLFKRTCQLGKKIIRCTEKLRITHPGIGGWIQWESETEQLLSLETSMFRKIFFNNYNPDRLEIKKMKKLLQALRKLS